jgi:hypothetical protein
VVAITLTGTGFQSGTVVNLTRSGSADIVATDVQMANDALSASVNLAGASAGVWDVVATNPGGETAKLPAAFTVIGAIWSETFDGTVSGWTAVTGSNAWNLTSVQSHSPAGSFFCGGTGYPEHHSSHVTRDLDSLGGGQPSVEVLASLRSSELQRRRAPGFFLGRGRMV